MTKTKKPDPELRVVLFAMPTHAATKRVVGDANVYASTYQETVGKKRYVNVCGYSIISAESVSLPFPPQQLHLDAFEFQQLESAVEQWYASFGRGWKLTVKSLTGDFVATIGKPKAKRRK